MTMLSIVQDACARIGIPAPNIVAASTDTQVKQLLALLNVEGKNLSTGTSVGLSCDWQALQTEASFTSVATESQGAIATIAPGFKYIIGDTIWDRSRRLPAFGSMTPQEWQTYKAYGTTSPFPKYRVIGGLLKLMPIPAAGDSYYFEYQSSNWCASSGGAGKSAFTTDTDVGVLSEDFLTDGLVWRWKQVKGLNYAEDYAVYQANVTNAISRDVEKRTLNIGRAISDVGGVVIPIGNW